MAPKTERFIIFHSFVLSFPKPHVSVSQGHYSKSHFTNTNQIIWYQFQCGECIPTLTSNSRNTPECLNIQLNSDITYPRTTSDSTGWVLQDYPSPLQMLITKPGCYLYFWPTGYTSKVLMTSSCGLNNLLAVRLTELREKIYLRDYWFNIKWYNSGIVRWRKCTRRNMEKKCTISMPSLNVSLFQHLYLFINPEASWILLSWVFADVLTDKSLARGDRFNLQHLSPPRWSESRTESFNPLIIGLVPLARNSYL